MPRKYIRKKEQTYTIDTLQQAVQQIKEQKLSFRQAQEKYGVPRATLFDQVKRGGVTTMPKKGIQPVFNEKQENELVEFILKSCKAFFGVTIPTLRKIAFDFATAKNLKHNFNKETGMAGMDWYYNFMARHPNISLRRPEATSLNRITAFNPEETDIFFGNLKQLMIKFQFKSDSIYNVDETGISTVQRNSRILAPKGQKQVGKCTSAERGSLTTVVNCFNAGGMYIPPFFIFKRKRMNALLMKDSNSNMVACVSDSGWINESIFVDWLQHFKEFSKPTIDSPILLVLDNHESHVSLQAYEFCRKNFIHILTLPPHTSHRMQPLDLTFHGPLKTAYNRECENYMVNHPGSKITPYDVVGLYTKAFNRLTSIDKAINGFKSAGIFPVDQNKFKGTFASFGDVIEPITAPDTSSNANFDNSSQIESRNESQLTGDCANDTMSSGSGFPEVHPTANIDILNQNVPNEEFVRKDSDTNVVDKNQVISQTSQPSSVSLVDILQVPALKTCRSKRTIKKKHSVIFTSTPEKKNLEEKEQKKRDRKRKTENLENKNITNIKQKQPKQTTRKHSKGLKNLNNFETENENEEYFCIYCQEKYGAGPSEEWIMCIKCKKWAHEQCSAGSTSKGFTCELCE